MHVLALCIGVKARGRQLSSIGEHVLTLPKKTRVLPGHGQELTVATVEKSFDSWISAGPGAAASADGG